mmetsp:Transcript_11296/g.14165  ORF Transcript_11296/g.14165 Transcript_11296/m.14165 type:complete len:424 (+) Transcript_11296:204-1475(+)
MEFNKAQVIALVLAPMVTGSVSFVASLTLIIMIRRSTVKLSTIYRRLIFGLIVSNLIFSIGQLTSSFPAHNGTIWGAIGNDVSCDIQGFISVIGLCGAVLYSLSLSVYFLCATKDNLSHQQIKKRIEPFLHIFPLIYALFGGIFIYATQNFTSSGPMICWIDSSSFLFFMFVAGPVVLVFIASCLITTCILRTNRLHTQNAKNHRSAVISAGTTQKQEHPDSVSSTSRFCVNCKPMCCIQFCQSNTQQHNASESIGPLDVYLNSRPLRVTLQMRKDIYNRGIAYIIGYLMTYTFSVIFYLVNRFTDSTPFALLLLSRITLPLQGLFNILIYTYPHANSYHRNNDTYSWFRAFWEVFKSGGDSDEVRVSRRRSSQRQRDLVLQQSQMNARRNTRGTITSEIEDGKFEFIEEDKEEQKEVSNFLM